MVAPPHRSLLEMLVRESRWTIDDTCHAFEKKARDLGEQASLSSRQLSRWMRGEVGRPRPVMQRVAERFWGHTLDVLLGPPERRDSTADQHLATLDPKRLGTTAKVPSGTVIESGGRVISARLGHGATEQTKTSAMPGVPDGHDGLGSNLQRRILLQQAVAALAAGAVPALELVREGLAGSGGVPANHVDADEWSSVAQDYERASYTHSPQELIISLAAATRTATIMSGWPERRLWHAISYVQAQIGDSAQAAVAQERALALIPDTAPRSRAQVELHAAHCQVRDGYLDDGLRHAQAVITALPPQQRTALVTNVAQQVLDAVPENERPRPAVAEPRELLRAARPHGTPS